MIRHCLSMYACKTLRTIKINSSNWIQHPNRKQVLRHKLAGNGSEWMLMFSWLSERGGVNVRVPAGCGRPGGGCERGSALALRFLGSADSSVSWTGPQTPNQNQSLTWTHTQTAPAAEDMFTANQIGSPGSETLEYSDTEERFCPNMKNVLLLTLIK